MKLETFKAGVWRQQHQYRSFQPVPVNHAWMWEDANINALLEQATQALGELNAFSLIVPDQGHADRRRGSAAAGGSDRAREARRLGEFRTTQNWIGGSSFADAAFIPPSARLATRHLSDYTRT